MYNIHIIYANSVIFYNILLFYFFIVYQAFYVPGARVRRLPLSFSAVILPDLEIKVFFIELDYYQVVITTSLEGNPLNTLLKSHYFLTLLIS